MSRMALRKGSLGGPEDDAAPGLESGSAPTSALDEALRDHLHGLWRYLRMQGADAALADDLAQEAFLIAVQKRALDAEPAARWTFLQRTARFLFLRRCKAAVRDARELADAVDTLFARDCGGDGGDELLAATRACLERLEGRARRAVELGYGFGGDEPTSRRVIAAELGMQENGVKTLLQRSRQLLRDCIERRMAR